MKKLWNRPLTPHLTVYSGQYTSIYSIWHRITGITLIFLLVFYLFFLKLSSYGTITFTNNHFVINLWISNAIYLNTTLFFGYHTLNGLRHIFWDLGFMLPIIKVIKSSYLITSTLFISFLCMITKIIY